jgi:hypothetical protein
MENENLETQSVVQAPPIISTPPPAPKSNRPVIIVSVIVIFLLLAVGASAFYLGKMASSPKQVACTMEAKLCPDGSSVGRTGPKCEFASCPTTTPTPDETANWKTYTNTQYSFSFKYPLDWSFDEEKPSTIVFGPTSTINHIGETVSPYVSRFITLTISDSTPNQDLIVFKNISPSLSPAWKDTKVGEIDGKEVRHLGCLSGNCKDIIFQHDKTIFDFFDQNNLKELNQILSTFKFTDQTNPKAVTESFYTWYLSCLNEHFSQTTNSSYNKSPLEACPYHSNSYLIAPAKDLRAQGADPILCAQNTPQSIKVDKLTTSKDIAYVTVHTFYETGDNPITVELKSGQSGWQITNIICKQSVASFK